LLFSNRLHCWSVDRVDGIRGTIGDGLFVANPPCFVNEVLWGAIPVVSDVVSDHGAPPAVLQPTDIALKLLLTGVADHVSSEHRAGGESTSTHRAAVRLLSCVGSSVVLQTTGRVETFPAEVTDVGLVLVVDPHV